MNNFLKSTEIVEINRLIKEINVYRKEGHTDEECRDFCSKILKECTHLKDIVVDLKENYDLQYINVLYFRLSNYIEHIYGKELIGTRNGIEKNREFKIGIIFDNILHLISVFMGNIFNLIVLIASIVLFILSSNIDDVWWSDFCLAVGTGTISTFLVDILLKIRKEHFIKKRRLLKRIYDTCTNLKIMQNEEYQKYLSFNDYYVEYYILCLCDYKKFYSYILKYRHIVGMNSYPFTTEFLLMYNYYNDVIKKILDMEDMEIKDRIKMDREGMERILKNSISIIEDVSNAMTNLIQISIYDLDKKGIK